MDQSAGDGNLIAVAGLDVGFFENEVGGFGGGFIVQFFTFEVLIGGFDLIRDVRDRAEDDAGLGEFAAIHFGGSGATDNRPVEFGALAHLQIGTAAVLHGNFDFQNEVARSEGVMGFGIAP